MLSFLGVWVFLGGSVIKNLSATQETNVLSLGWEDPLEEGMAIHSSVLLGKPHGQRSLAAIAQKKKS